ncbi:MAG: ferritin family protein [Deltaproteobacteria bacterium]|nr:ferritin family protein [Deltaproteobacteria bacterium]
MFTVGEIIDLAIRIEKNGEKIYRKAGGEVSDPSLASLLEWLADEELAHEKWFVQLGEEVEPNVEVPRLEEMGKEILRGVLGDQAFSIKEVDFSRMEDINDLLSLSLEFEKDTILFYEMLSEFIDDAETIRQLGRIIEEEHRHVEILEEFLEKGEVPERGGHA